MALLLLSIVAILMSAEARSPPYIPPPLLPQTFTAPPPSTPPPTTPPPTAPPPTAPPPTTPPPTTPPPTTPPPTTPPPTTPPPTTQPPTTPPPTTQPPTTPPPTTLPPTTPPPTTPPPTTPPPTTPPPTAPPPTTPSPTTPPPTTPPPTTPPPTTPPPTTPPPTPPPTTTATGCMADHVGWLEVGEERLEHTDLFSCTVYMCEEGGELVTMVGDCLSPRCVDPVRGPENCCRICPNGNNCRLPTGDVMPATEERVVGNQLCRCPPQSEELGGPPSEEHHMALCEDLPTPGFLASPTPPTAPQCRSAYDGRVFDWLQPGEEKQQGCEICFCTEDFLVHCAIIDCPPPSCVDPFWPADGCCAQCPNGQNCRLPSGEVLAMGEITEDDDGTVCWCQNDLWDGFFRWGEPEAECISLTPPTLFTECRTDDDRVLDWLQPGETKERGCESCTCSEAGEAVCALMSCAEPLCDDAVTPPGGCCPVCPDGDYCELPSGEQIRKGETVQIEDMICACLDDEDDNNDDDDDDDDEDDDDDDEYDDDEYDDDEYDDDDDDSDDATFGAGKPEALCFRLPPPLRVLPPVSPFERPLAPWPAPGPADDTGKWPKKTIRLLKLKAKKLLRRLNRTRSKMSRRLQKKDRRLRKLRKKDE